VVGAVDVTMIPSSFALTRRSSHVSWPSSTMYTKRNSVSDVLSGRVSPSIVIVKSNTPLASSRDWIVCTIGVSANSRFSDILMMIGLAVFTV
jgi:hypothetical protein